MGGDEDGRYSFSLTEVMGGYGLTSAYTLDRETRVVRIPFAGEGHERTNKLSLRKENLATRVL